MAPELRARKPKAAPVEAAPAPAAKKATKAAKPKAETKTEKRKASDDASPVAPKKQKKPVAAKEDDATPLKSALKTSKKKASKGETAPKPAPLKKLKPKKEEEEAEEEIPITEEEKDVEGADDETLALVDTLDDGHETDDGDILKQQFSKFKDGELPRINKAFQKSTEDGSSSSNGKPGVMCLTRIPHGFYEHQLWSYFGQFGKINRLRLARNKKTGASKHFAFLEFADANVAEIAAKTMDRYLLFGHILRAKIVPSHQAHPNLFKGANRRFKVVPWNKMAGKQLERALSESKWQVKISKEEARRQSRAEKLKDMMDYEYEAPKLKAAEAKEVPSIEQEEVKAIEDAPAPTETAEEKEDSVPIAPELLEASAPVVEEEDPKESPAAQKTKKKQPARGKKAKK
ncbi:putative RNA-binding protein [Diplogelasinospora grovesii]|uniref:RNA-binding protein n=1 Tax=Diplogelasinospora grovesii TaxID=303347 RepID=A0AAN6NJ96_9PEZI|nr:putative RNA-binding protein [Diplogelasinospora grovesii]